MSLSIHRTFGALPQESGHAALTGWATVRTSTRTVPMWPRTRSTRRLVPTVAALVLVLAACGGSEPAADAEPRPAKVTIAGDSISVGLGAQLREQLPEGSDVKVIGVEGSGLARADVYDWPGRLSELARDFPPDVLVLSLGSNDAQDLVTPTGEVRATLSDDGAWDEEYRSRLAAAFDVFEDTGTTVVWVGHVRTEEDRVGLVNRRVHRLAEQLATERDWVVSEDLAEILGSGEQVASDCLVPDGLHLQVGCLDRAALYLANAMPR